MVRIPVGSSQKQKNCHLPLPYIGYSRAGCLRVCFICGMVLRAH